MSILTILLFFVYLWGLGFSITKLVNTSSYNSFEKHFMNLGIGLSVFIVLGILLNLFRIPLDWRIFLFFSLILPLYHAAVSIKSRKFPNFSIKFTKSNIYFLIIILLFIFTFYMYHKGAFSYPYLEDDDPWAHALGIKYVSLEKTVYVPKEINGMGTKTLDYVDAYPPGYDMFFGILHQTSSDLMWTLKFFNALIISLGIFFFYFFVKSFTGSYNKALFSTFALTMIPCYLSHFIWAHSFMPTLFFVAMYCLLQMKFDKKWGIIAAIVIASTCLSQPTNPVKFSVMFFIYWALYAYSKKNWNLKLLGSIAAGYVFAILVWWIPMIMKYGSELLSKGLGQGEEIGTTLVDRGIIGSIGSATRFYDIKDFLLLNKPDMLLFNGQNMINNPVGIGIVLCVLAALGTILFALKYKSFNTDENWYKPVTLLWLIFTFLGLYGGTIFPIALESFMFWMLLAIPVSILASEGALFFMSLGKSIKIPKIAVAIILISLIWYTSGQQKYTVNTVQWGPGGWLSPAPGVLYSYLWAKENLPIDTPVFVYSLMGSSTAGFNLYSCEWCSDVKEFRKSLPEKSVKEAHAWLKSKGYKYVIVDDYYLKNNGENKTISMIQEMVSSNLFSKEYQANVQGQLLPGFVFRVK